MKHFKPGSAAANVSIRCCGDLLDDVSLTCQTAPASSGAAQAIPLPAAFWTGLSGLLGLSVILRRPGLRRRIS